MKYIISYSTGKIITVFSKNLRGAKAKATRHMAADFFNDFTAYIEIYEFDNQLPIAVRKRNSEEYNKIVWINY